MKKLVSLLNAYAARKDAPGIDEMPFANTKIEKNLEINLQIIKKMLGESNDIIIRRFEFGQKRASAAMICIGIYITVCVCISFTGSVYVVVVSCYV